MSTGGETSGAHARPPELRRAETGSAHARRVAPLLQGFASLLAEPLDLESVSERVLSCIADEMPSGQSALLLLQAGDEPLSLLARRGFDVTEDEAVWIAEASGRCLHECCVLRIEDTHAARRCASIRERSGHFRSALLVPILEGGERLGLLELGDTRPGAFSSRDERRLGMLADAAGVWLRHVRKAIDREQECTRLQSLNEAKDREIRALEPKRRSSDRSEALDRLARGPAEWVDFGGLVETARRVVLEHAKPEVRIEARMAELPPVRCKRILILQLLVDLLECVAADASGEDAVRIEASPRGECVHVEVVGEAAMQTGTDPLEVFAEVVRARERRRKLGVAMDIVGEHDGSLSVECGDEQVVIHVILPVDRD